MHRIYNHFDSAVSSSSSAVFFCIRRLTCNAAGSSRPSVVRKILYFLIRVQSSPAFDVIVFAVSIWRKHGGERQFAICQPGIKN